MSQINKINEYLGKFGSINNKSVFRLVWSEDQYENRYGTYNEFHGDIFLRTVTGVKLVRKYPHIKERWVLERFFPPEVSYTTELPDSVNGSYEPLWVFQDSIGNYLEPILPAIEYIMYCLDKGKVSVKESAEYEEMMQEKALDEAIQNAFDEESVLADKLKFGEAVFIKEKI